jgi:hypothetical protein
VVLGHLSTSSVEEPFPRLQAGQTGGFPTERAPTIAGVRLMLAAWLFVIVGGLTLFTVIGLTHS